MFTGEQLAKWAERALALGAKYWYGTCWYDAAEDLLKRKAKQYPLHYTSGRMATYRKHIAEGRMVCDCVGLIKGFFWTSNGAHANKYKANNCPDTSANGMIKLCEETGTLANMPEERGLVVWRSGHIGVYVGNGKVIEARGYKYGVVKTNLHSRGWKKWGRLPDVMLDYDRQEKAENSNTKPARKTLRKGMIGDAVKEMQQALTAAGFGQPKYLTKYGIDGEFGSETVKAVKAFQKKKGLKVDGIVGPKTWAALCE